MDDQNQDKGWKKKLFQFLDAFVVFLDVFLAGLWLGWIASFHSCVPLLLEILSEAWGL